MLTLKCVCLHGMICETGVLLMIIEEHTRVTGIRLL